MPYTHSCDSRVHGRASAGIHWFCVPALDNLQCSFGRTIPKNVDPGPIKRQTSCWEWRPLYPMRTLGVMVAASTWRKNATDQTSTAPAARTPGPATEMVRQPFFSKVGDASPADASILQLLAGDVETNPGPSCYACGQNFRQSDTPLNCHAQDCRVISHKQTRCSGVPRSQQSLLWHCPTHGRPGPPVITQMSHACYSCHHPFRPGTRPLTFLAQGCMNLAHAAGRCSGATAPPDQRRCLHHRNSTETVAGVPASALHAQL